VKQQAAARAKSTAAHPATAFVEHRERLVSVAYRIVGSAADAEDVVQEAWLRWSTVDQAEVRDQLAFLVRVTTRLSLDRLRRVKARRETYPGEWLPEPLVTDRSVEDDAIQSEAVSIAMVRVLETLSPLERAVFVLREAFDLPYAEIGETLGRTEPTVRKLAGRARDHVESKKPRFEADQATRHDISKRFIAATRTGDLGDLMSVLAPGVTLIADSGGKVRAPLLPVLGADKVARFLLSVAARELGGLRIAVVSLNGGPAVVVSSVDGAQAALEFDVVDGRIQTIYLVANPDKLAGMSRADGGAASSG